MIDGWRERETADELVDARAAEQETGRGCQGWAGKRDELSSITDAAPDADK
jgi:hypothetical protein